MKGKKFASLSRSREMRAREAITLDHSPTSGQREEGLEEVWIVKVDPKSCRLVHGDNAEKETEDALEFLQRLIEDEPYWSAF